jgi:predicted MFS family arabinose efflux permease
MIPLFVLGHFCHHVMTAITVPLMPYIRNEFNLDYAQSGLVVSAFTLAYGFSQLPAGWLADRIERRILLTVSISGVALAGVLVGLSQSYMLMFLFLILMGILAGGYHPSAPPLIMATVRRENLGSALGFHNIGGSASNVVTPLLAVAVANALGWRNAYIALAVPMVLFGLFFHFQLGRIQEREKAEAAAGAQPKAATQEPPPGPTRYLVTFLVLSIVTFAFLISTYAFVPLLMVDHFGVSKEIAAGSLAVIYSAGLWANPLGGWLADRLGSIRVILVVCLIAGPAIFLVTQLPYGWGLAAIFLVMGFVVFARMSASEAYIVRRTSARNRSTILGIYFFAGQEGGAMLTPLVGYLIDRFGFATAYGLAGATVLVTTLICAFLLWEEGKRKDI